MGIISAGQGSSKGGLHDTHKGASVKAEPPFHGRIFSFLWAETDACGIVVAPVKFPRCTYG